jgi:hypothetical protein
VPRPPGILSEISFDEFADCGITYEQEEAVYWYKQYLSNLCGLKAKDQYRYECFLPTPEQFETVQTAMDSVNSMM